MGTERIIIGGIVLAVTAVTALAIKERDRVKNFFATAFAKETVSEPSESDSKE